MELESTVAAPFGSGITTGARLKSDYPLRVDVAASGTRRLLRCRRAARVSGAVVRRRVTHHDWIRAPRFVAAVDSRRLGVAVWYSHSTTTGSAPPKGPGPVFTFSWRSLNPKPHLSYAEQLERLKSRGMSVDADEFALATLERVGYYTFSGYSHSFRFKNGTGGRTDNFRPGRPSRMSNPSGTSTPSYAARRSASSNTSRRTFAPDSPTH